MAEAIARQDAADVFEVASAGLSPLGEVPGITGRTLVANGYSADGLSSKRVERAAFDDADLVINISGYPAERAFLDPSKVEDWDVDDPYGADPEIYQRIFEDIQGRVAALAARYREQGK